MSNQSIMIMTACGSIEEAQTITTALIERRLAASIQSSTISSTYRWQGEINTAVEIRLVIKSKANLFTAIEDCIKNIHSYDCPEIIAVPITQSSKECLQWIEDEID
jgi:periplasmic divalent cation tolerance protein